MYEKQNTSMTLLDKVQNWLMEIVGTIIFIIITCRFILDLFIGTSTFEIYWYVVGFAISLLLMGYKGLANILLKNK